MIRILVITTFLMSLLGGCTSQQLYAAGRQAQKAECNKLPDSAQRERCFQDANMSHDAYQRGMEAQAK